MADVKFEVVRVALPTSGTVDATISGFGTPKAAIFIGSRAVTDDSVIAEASFSVGFTDGTREFCVTLTEDDAQSTTRTARSQKAGVLDFITGAAVNGVTYGFNSWVTDGVRIDITAGSTGVSRLATVILIGGADVSAYCNQLDDLGTGTSAVNVTAPGADTDLLFVASTGDSNAPSSITTQSIFSFGAAHLSGGVEQACSMHSGQAAVTTSNNTAYIANDAVAGQAFNGSLAWKASAAQITNGFSLTPSASAGSDIVFYLALSFSTQPDVKIKSITLPASGNYAETGIGFTPDFGMLSAIVGVASANTITTANVYSSAISAFDGSNIYTTNVQSEDAVGTSNTHSLSSDQFRILAEDNSGDSVLASGYAFDADGWDFTLTTNPASAVLGWALAIGAGGGAAVTVGQSSETDTAQTITPDLGALSVSIGQSSETDAAQTITPVVGALTVSVGQAVETSTAQSIVAGLGVLAVSFGLAAETNTSQTITPVVGVNAVSVGQSVETDTAQSISPVLGALSVSIGQSSETDTSQTITPLVAATQVGLASETDTAQPITAVIEGAADVGQASETDTALPILAGRTFVLGRAFELDRARRITPLIAVAQNVSIGIAQETDSAPGVDRISANAPTVYFEYEEHLSPIKKRGKAILSRPLQAGETISIERKTPITQEINFRGVAVVDPNQIEYAFDKICFIEQEIEGSFCDCRGTVWPPPGVTGPPEEEPEDFDGFTGDVI